MGSDRNGEYDHRTPHPRSDSQSDLELASTIKGKTHRLDGILPATSVRDLSPFHDIMFLTDGHPVVLCFSGLQFPPYFA